MSHRGIFNKTHLSLSGQHHHHGQISLAQKAAARTNGCLEWYLPSDDVEQFRTERARRSLNLCRCRDPSLAGPTLKQPMLLVSASRWLKKSHQLLRASPQLLRHCSKMWRRMILLQIRQWMMLSTLPEESPMPKPKRVACEP